MSRPVDDPAAQPRPVVETLHGQRVSDPFRHLESMDEAAPWIEAQNARCDRWMASHARPDVAARLHELFGVGTLGGPVRRGSWLFFTEKAGEQEQAVLNAQHDDGRRTTLVNPNTLDASGKTSLDWYHPSHDGELVAFGTSTDGDENSTLRVIETATATRLDDVILRTRAASVAWLPDRSGFYYTRFPGDEALGREVFFHVLGDDPAADSRVMGSERLPKPTDWPGARLSDDGRWLVSVRSVNWSESTVHVLDRETGAWTDIAPSPTASFSSVDIVDGAVWAISTHGAPLGRAVKIDLARPAMADWIELVPEGDGPLHGLSVIRDGLVTHHLRDAASQLVFRERDGAETATVPMPMAGTVTGWSTRPDRDDIVFTYESFFYPPALMSASRAAPTPAVIRQIEADVDASAFAVTSADYTSYDGTRVPISIVHRKGIALDGRHPTILYGYGGFNISLTPYFQRTLLLWLEQGGVYAVAHLRGGGERGEVWHEAGTKGKKFQVFEDFEYAMRHLIRSGYTQPDRLAIMGGSNGGLLVGALLTRASHLFAAAVAKVGLYDMVRYHRFPPAELWVDEYGTADAAAEIGFLWAYSPYHQVLPGVRYPAVLASTNDTDTRVNWAHTAKFTAALQAATAGDAPVLLRFERATGHGAGKSTSDIVTEYVETYQFLLATIGRAPEASPNN